MFWDGNRWVDERAWTMCHGILVPATSALAPKRRRSGHAVASSLGKAALTTLGILVALGAILDGPLLRELAPAAPRATPSEPTTHPTPYPTRTPTSSPKHSGPTADPNARSV